MKKLGFVLAVVSIFVFFVVAYAQGPDMTGEDPGWNFCPYCGNYIGPRGGYGTGPGMMGGYGRGYGMGPGMMGGYGRGYGMGPGMMGRYGGGYGMGPGMMGGYGYGGCTNPRGCYNQSEECQKFLNDTSKERKELNDKKFEYKEAYRNPKTSSETLTKLGKEIWELQEKIYSKAPLGCW